MPISGPNTFYQQHCSASAVVGNIVTCGKLPLKSSFLQLVDLISHQLDCCVSFLIAFRRTIVTNARITAHTFVGEWQICVARMLVVDRVIYCASLVVVELVR